MAEEKFGTKCTQDDLRPAFLFASFGRFPYGKSYFSWAMPNCAKPPR
jgi:hypothetical protein